MDTSNNTDFFKDDKDLSQFSSPDELTQVFQQFIGGLRNVTLKITGTMSGTLKVGSKVFADDTTVTNIQDITTAGTYDITIGDTDNYLWIEADTDFTTTDSVLQYLVKKKSSLSTAQEEIPDSVDKGLAYTTTATPTANENDIYTAGEAGTIFNISNVRAGDYLYAEDDIWWCLRKELFESVFLHNPSTWYKGDYEVLTIVQKLAIKCISNIDIEYFHKPSWWNDSVKRLRRLNGTTSSYTGASGVLSVGFGVDFDDTSNTVDFAAVDFNIKQEFEIDDSTVFITVVGNADFMPYFETGLARSIISTNDAKVLQLEIDTDNEIHNFTAYQYTKGQREVAHQYGLPLLDLFKESGINVENYTLYTETDKVHPNDDAYLFIRQIIAKFIESNTETTGKTIGWFGGSFCRNAITTIVGPPAYNQVIKDYVDSELGCTSINYAVGGAGFSDQASSSITSQVTGSAVHDIYILWCSTNDYSKTGARIGGLNNSLTNTQSYGMEESIKEVYTINPSAKILVINTMKTFENINGYDITAIRNL